MKNHKIKWYPSLFAKLNTRVTFWFCVFLLLFFYQQKQLVYHFYFIEQEQLFLWSRNCFFSFITKPAGLAGWLAAFCIQFFISPYMAALITSAWLTAAGMLTAEIIRRIAPTSNLFILSLLPVFFLLFLHFDMYYYYAGTIAFTIMLAVLYGYLYISKPVYRIVYCAIFGIVLFWGLGAIAFLFLAGVLLWEILNRSYRALSFIIPLLPVSGLVLWCVYSSSVSDYRFLILPDGYYNFRLRPGIVIYFSWGFLFLLLLLCRFMRDRKQIRGKLKYIESSFQLLLVVISFQLGMGKFVNRSSDFYKELDYYMRTEQWDRIIKRCSGNIKNYMYMCSLNLALSEKGSLSERMFSFSQQGVRGVFLPWNKSLQSSVLLSDIYFSMGHIALAQRMAFEANEIIPDPGGPRMLKRLIQTNLIFGAYPVAEKYIDLLEQTKYYKNWARSHRRFLWNDEAVENDSLLGLKRKCIPKENFISELRDVVYDLEYIAVHNPANQASIQYAGAFYLLSKEILLFKAFVEKYYGTDVLPALPKSYQEAIIILSEQDPACLEQYAISEPVILRYQELRRLIGANRQNDAALPGLLKKSFGDTYWYYYLFTQNDG